MVSGLVVVALVHLATAGGAAVHTSGSRVAALLAGATRGEALHDDVGLDVDEQRGVEATAHLGQGGVKGHGLGRVAREAVENEALLGVIGVKALGHEVDDELVGDELAVVHVGLGLDAELGASLDGGAEQVAVEM